jgi:RNA polymerase sigma-70 factor (ECF subfamily)
MAIRDALADQIPRLRRYARALIRNRELADDLVQDTLERALANDELFQEGTDLRAWLFTMMHNVYVNTIRKASARAAHVDIDDESMANSDKIAFAPDPSRQLTLRDLDHALQLLPVDQREVVLLVGLEEMTYADAASTLGIPLGTVMSRLSRGRERLRLLMSGSLAMARPEVAVHESPDVTS